MIWGISRYRYGDMAHLPSHKEVITQKTDLNKFIFSEPTQVKSLTAAPTVTKSFPFRKTLKYT
jgi:hypothetical protein